MIFEKNKIWGGLPTPENIALTEKYPYSYANSDHVLVISPIAPQGMKEITEDFYPLFKADDWEWIDKVAADILKEQESKYADEYLKWQSDFIERFEAELKKAKESAQLGNGTNNEASAEH